MTPADATILAVDGGNSKADVAILRGDGALLAAVRGPTISHQVVALDEAARRLRSLVERAVRESGAGSAAGMRTIAVHCLAGADYPEDVRELRRAFGRAVPASQVLVLNDTFAALRAGATRSWGIALICGQGINGAAVGIDGKRIRFAGVGEIAGDWGGAGSVGMAGLGAAARARDGRGPKTALEKTIPAAVGLRRPDAVTHGYYAGRLDERRVGELAPVVFATAMDGDPVARQIIDRLADELVVMAAALARRAYLVRRAPEVVLGGGVFRTPDVAFHRRIEAGISRAIPGASSIPLASPPVLGAALIGLDALAATATPAGAAPAAVDPRIAARAREELDRWAATARVVTAS